MYAVTQATFILSGQNEPILDHCAWVEHRCIGLSICIKLSPCIDFNNWTSCISNEISLSSVDIKGTLLENRQNGTYEEIRLHFYISDCFCFDLSSSSQFVSSFVIYIGQSTTLVKTIIQKSEFSSLKNNKRYSRSSEISSEVRIFEATRAWKWYMMLNWLRRQSAKKELSRSIIDSCRRIMLSQRWYLWYSSDQIIGYIRCQTWATVRVLRISVRLGNDSRQKLSKVSFEISQKLRKILPNPKSEIYKALESWFLRPFSGWRYCFHGHFGEIRDSLKRDNRHSD